MEPNRHPARIVIGLDGSIGAAHALQWAIDIARRLDAEIVAVHIESGPTYLPAPMGVMPPTGTEEERLQLRESFAAEWCAPLRNSGVRFRSIVEEGAPAGTVLIAVGVREGADMIVVGSRGLNAVTEFLLGSVSHQVAHHSAIPVVIVPHPVRVRVEAKPQLDDVRQSALLPVF